MRLHQILLLADLWLVQAFEGSCAGKCGSWAEDCWCNDQCEERGNCCDDYKEQCQQQCEKCGKYTCDEWIAWDPAKNSCASLKKDWLCQCKGCHCGADFDANLQLFSPKDYPDAQCLDGSMAGVYIRKGSYKQTLIFLEGGGWCYDPSCQPQASATLQDCQKRSYGRLGSSSTWAQTMPERYLRGMLSANAEENPIFHNWTLVYVPYCDGASFTGDQIVRYEGKDLHFKGSKILEALLDTLRWTETKQLVVSGGSAGALAVLMHIDEIAEKVQRPGLEVRAIADAGFFLDLRNVQGVRCWPEQLISLFNVSSAWKSISSSCLKQFQPSEWWMCLFPQYFAHGIQTRTFLVNSFYDSSEITYTLGLDCCPGGCARQKTCGAKELRLFERLRLQHMGAWSRMLRQAAGGHGLWAPSCIDHTLTSYHWLDPDWKVPEEGEMLADAVGRWLGQSGMSPLIYEDSEPWPENRPCAATDAQPDSKKHARSRSHSKTHTDSQPDGQQKATWPAGVVLVVLAVGVLLAAGVGAALAIRRQRRRPGEGAGVALAGAERTFEYELQDAGTTLPQLAEERKRTGF